MLIGWARAERKAFVGRVTVLALALVCGGAAWAKAGTVSTAADRVLAQPNLTSNVLNQPTVKSPLPAERRHP
jgi:hypothetical protein